MMKTTQEKIAVMQAHIDGKVIESKSHIDIFWYRTFTPVFNWSDFDYRVKPEEPDYIDWSHVHEDLIYMARESDNDVFLYSEKPSNSVHNFGWCMKTTKSLVVDAKMFASYKQGTVDWKDSLVERPKS